MRKFFILYLYALSIGLFGGGASLLAQNQSFPSNAKVADIQLDGLQIIDNNYVFSLISTEVGSLLSPRVIANDIRSIYSGGFADEVSVEAVLISDNNYQIRFIIKEKPRVEKITFSINGKIYTQHKELAKKIKTIRYSLLNTEVLAKDVRAIINDYRRRKFYNVKVFYDVVKTSSATVDIQFNIIEESRIYVTEINIKGSKYFYPLYLKRLLETRKIDCFSWITASGTLDENLINLDVRTIYQAYADQGFIKLKIHRPRIRIFQNREVAKAIVDIYLEEGARYTVNKIAIEPVFGESLLVDTQVLHENFELKEQELFSQSKFTADRSYLDNFYSDRGYAYTKINVTTPIDDEKKTIDILYNVEHKKKVYINRINIQGNQTTRDYVIRRELELQDQQLFRSSKLQESRDNLLRLGFFDAQTGVRFIDTENLDKTIDYELTVKEALTGTFNFSLTYAPHSGFGFATRTSKTNFRGKGQTISLTANYYGENDYAITARLVEPYFLDTKLSSSSSANFSQYVSENSEGHRNYNARNYYLSQSFGQPIWRNWKIFYRLFGKWGSFTDVSEEGLDLINYYPENSEHGIGLELNYSTVNHPIFSSRGLSFALGSDFIGLLLGGAARYNKLTSDLQYFKSFNQAESVVFMARHRYNRLFAVESNIIPPTARLAIGGPTTIRGFNYSSINGASSPAERSADFSPSDLKESDLDLYRYYKLHENGTIMSLFNVELLFPVSPDNSYVRGVIFYDMGNVWSEPEVYDITGAKLDYNYYRKSYGAGVRIISPAGVIRLEYAMVLDPLPTEDSSRLEFFIGSLF